MRDYLDRVLPDIAGFFKAKYKTVPEPSHNYFLDKGEKRRSACGEFNTNDYVYCSDDHSVYVGGEHMWSLYSDVGSIAPAVLLVHEWGHNIQFRKGVPEPPKDHKEKTVQYELQADCVAGAWIQYLGQQNLLDQEDLLSIAKLTPYFARVEPPNGNHGTPGDRRDAMSLGTRDGLRACNKFDPSHPIFTSQD